MPLPITPRSRTLAALSVARGTFMDTITVRKWHVTLAVFFSSWFILFSIFICFYPQAFLGDTDYLQAPGVPAAEGSDVKNQGDGVLSDAGRSIVWGSSLGFAALVAFIYYFFYVQFF